MTTGDESLWVLKPLTAWFGMLAILAAHRRPLNAV
jgi:hypothetical protein